MRGEEDEAEERMRGEGRDEGHTVITRHCRTSGGMRCVKCEVEERGLLRPDLLPRARTSWQQQQNDPLQNGAWLPGEAFFPQRVWIACILLARAGGRSDEGKEFELRAGQIHGRCGLLFCALFNHSPESWHLLWSR